MIFSSFRSLLATASLLAWSSPALAQQPVPEIEELGSAAVEGQVYELSLDDAVALAQQRSFRTARAQRNLGQNQLRYRNARAQYLPRLNSQIHADQSARGVSSDYYAQPQGQFRGSAAADVSIPLDVAGVIKRQVRQADTSRDISSNDLANVMLDVTLEVQNAYLNALRAQNSADADEGVVRRVEELLARAGPSSAIAPFLQVELGNARQAAQNSRENAENAQDGLKRILRAPPEARLRLTTDFSDQLQEVDRQGLLDRALHGRPDIQAALLRVRHAETAIQQASDYRKPTVRIGAYASQQYTGRNLYGGDFDRYRQHGGGLNVSVPFLQWDNGQLQRNKEIARIQREQAESDVRELRERVAYELRQQLLAVTRAENRIGNLPDSRQAAQALQRAEQALLGASPEVQQGLLAQVSNARQAWRSAETANADAYIDYNNAVFRLKRLIGESHDLDQEHEPPGVALIDPMAQESASAGAGN